MAKLALSGGPRTLDRERAGSWKEPLVSEAAIETVVDMMRKGDISRSPSVEAFEERFASYIGVKYAIALTNGTAALTSAFFASGIGPGDEVILPSYTFWASAAPIRMLGATAVFCDVQKHTYNMDPKDVERRITDRTAAVVPVDCWGNPADMDAILKIARKHDLVVIDDASHAHGATWKEKKVGSYADISCFSLQASKLLTGGESGVLVTDNREYYERAIAFGRATKIRDLPEDSPWRRFWLTGFGNKFRSHPLAIAIANDGLERLDERNQAIWENARYFEDGISDLPCIRLQAVDERAYRTYAYHYLRYDETKLEGVSLAAFAEALAAEGVRVGKCGFGWLHGAPLFTEENLYGTDHQDWRPSPRVRLPVTEYLRDHTFLGAPRFEKAAHRGLAEDYVRAYHKVAAAVDELKAHEVTKDL